MKTRLAKAEKELGNIELLIGEATNADETAALLKKAGAGTPVLAINLNCFALTRMVQPILDGNHPMVVFSLPASGHDWMYPHRWQRQGHPVTLLPSSDYDELERALRLLRVIPMMQQTRILLFPPAQGTAPARSPEEVKKRLGAEVVAVDEKTFDDRISAADEKAVQAEAARWTKGAKAILEPSQEDITKAARISIALQDLMEQQQAQGLAIGTCMGWLAKGFPCLGFTRLRDCWHPGRLRGRHGLVADHAPVPVRDRSSRFPGQRDLRHLAQRFVDRPLHGAAANGRPGRQARTLPAARAFRGARQRLRARSPISRRRDHHPHQADQPGHDPRLDRQDHRSPGEIGAGCRTQIVTEVRDAAKMAVNWSSALETEDAMTLLHRVVFYGDHMDSLQHLARLMKLNVVEEG